MYPEPDVRGGTVGPQKNILNPPTLSRKPGDLIVDTRASPSDLQQCPKCFLRCKNSACNCYVLIQFANTSGGHKGNPSGTSGCWTPIATRITYLNPTI